MSLRNLQNVTKKAFDSIRKNHLRKMKFNHRKKNIYSIFLFHFDVGYASHSLS